MPWNPGGDVVRRRMLLITGIITMLCLSGGTMVCAWDIDSGIIREWAIDGVRPYGIETLSDGSVWFTSDNDPVVFTLNPETGEPVTYTAPFDGDFLNMDRAPDDTLWIVDENDRLVHFSPCNASGEYFEAVPINRTLFTLESQPQGIRVAPDGMVWFTLWPDPSIGRYDPATGNWDRFVIPEIDSDGDSEYDDYPGTPSQMAFDDEGNVTFTLNELFNVGGSQGWAGFGELDPDTGDVTLYNDPALYTANLLAPWEIMYVSTEPDILWFTDKSANYFIRVDLSESPPQIEEYPTPLVMDAHFFAPDPDGMFWLAPYGIRNISTFDPVSHDFERRPLAIGRPFNVVVSPRGEVWWTVPGAGEQPGVVEFIPFTDSDGDGIDDAVDSAPGAPSGLFSDGGTSGTLLDAGDQVPVITDATPPFGIRVMMDCGGGPGAASVRCCDPRIRSITMTSCDDIVVTCGDSTFQVLAGPVLIELENGAVLAAQTATTFTFGDLGGGSYRIVNTGCPGTGMITAGTRTIAPGEFLVITPPVAEANGPYILSEGRPVAFSSAGSMDPDAGDTITYAWDFTGDGSVDSVAANPTYTYPSGGTFTVRLAVTDSTGLAATDTAAVVINRGPKITSFSPATLVHGRTMNVAILGNHFQRGATARLVKGGTILPVTIRTLTPPTTIAGSVAIPGGARGKWSIVVKNPDGGTCTRANAVTII